MTPERIDALRRQRALMAGHLAWLDAEIASAGDVAQQPAETLSTLQSAAPAETVSPAPITLVPTSDAPAKGTRAAETITPESEHKLANANSRADAILEQYAATDRYNPAATRRGCILSATATLLFGIAAVIMIYLIYYR